MLRRRSRRARHKAMHRVIGVVAAAALAAAGVAGQNASQNTRLGIAVSPECKPILAKANLTWLTKKFKCSDGKRSTKPIVVGTGLGDTGTHSVAAAVEALGFQSCHRWKINLELLRLSRPDDLRPFARADAYSFAARTLRRLVAATPRPRRGHSAETSRAAAAASTRTLREDESRRRRNHDADIPRTAGTLTRRWRRSSRAWRARSLTCARSTRRARSTPATTRGLAPEARSRRPSRRRWAKRAPPSATSRGRSSNKISSRDASSTFAAWLFLR